MQALILNFFHLEIKIIQPFTDDKQDQIDLPPKRKKKIVKDLRVTVTKLPVENNHLLDKIKKLEKVSADYKTCKHDIKDSQSEKYSFEKSTKIHDEKNKKLEFRSYEHNLRSDRVAKNKQLKKYKENEKDKFYVKDSEISENSKKNLGVPKIIKKDDFTNSTNENVDVTKCSRKESFRCKQINKLNDKESCADFNVKTDDITELKKNIKLKRFNNSDCKSKKKTNKQKLNITENSDEVLGETITKELPVFNSTNIDDKTNSLTTMLIKKKNRRRKTINRTGFPTVKKKKKKQTVVSSATSNNEHQKVLNNEFSNQVDVESNNIDLKKKTQKNINIKENKKIKDLCKSIDMKINIKKKEAKSKEIIKKNFEVLCINELDEHKTIESKNNDDKILDINESKTIAEKSVLSTSYVKNSKDLAIKFESCTPCDKLCPVQYEKIQDSRMFNENATLEESLERLNSF